MNLEELKLKLDNHVNLYDSINSLNKEAIVEYVDHIPTCRNELEIYIRFRANLSTFIKDKLCMPMISNGR